MRYVVLTLFLLVPLTAAAQNTSSLPSIGLPLPQIGLSPSKNPPWEVKTLPWWERQRPPAWERKDDIKPDHGRPGHRPVRPFYGYGYPIYGYPIYVVEPYVVEVPQPQIIYVEVPRREEPPPEPPPPPPVEPPPPYVPSGNLTIYVIPGCYVGNVYPVGLKLPMGCDLNKVVTFIP
jgi:hypothetical protein